MKGNGELVRQPHGGALKRGGTHPRPGRPPGAIRAECRADFEKARPELLKLALSKAKKTRDADRLRAIELLGRFGLDETINRSDVAAALQGTLEDIRAFLQPHLDDERILDLMSTIRVRWRGL